MRLKTLLDLSLCSLLFSCGTDVTLNAPGESAADYINDQYVAAKDHTGKKANEVREGFSDRGISSGNTADQYVEAKDHVGKKSNESREYMTDRGIDSGNTADQYVEAKDHSGKKANEVRKGFSDSGVSSGNTADQYVYAKDHTGKKAQESRDYTYDRGIREMRHGDKDLTDKVDSNTTRIETLEALSDLHGSILAVHGFALSALAQADADLAAQLQAAKQEVLDEVNALRSEVDADIISLLNEIAMLQDRAESAESAIAQLEAEIVDLETRDTQLAARISYVKWKLTRDVRRLQLRVTFNSIMQNFINQQLFNRVSDLEDDVASLQSNVTGLNLGVLGLYFYTSYLNGQISDNADAIANLDDATDSRLDALESDVGQLQTDVTDLGTSLNALTTVVANLPTFTDTTCTLGPQWIVWRTLTCGSQSADIRVY